MVKEKSVLTGLKIGVIGTGSMGASIIRGLAERSVYPQNIRVFDVDKKKLTLLRKEIPIRITATHRQCASLSDIVILAVKPQIVLDVLGEIATSLSPQTLLISIAAGVPLRKLQAAVKRRIPFIRVMPNMPALLGVGMSAYSSGRSVSTRHKKMAEAVLRSFGEVVQVPERLLDHVTAVSGSGPAYYFLLAEKMIEAAYELGMKVDIAKKLVYQTAFGSAKVMVDSGEDPEDLIAKVVSKGGTTEAALRSFRKSGFGKVVQDAVKAANRRSKEISRGI